MTTSTIVPALLEITIPGKPTGQGSMTLARNPGTGKEFVRYPSNTVNHRNYVVSVLAEAWDDELAIRGPVAVRAAFRFQRPLAHFGTGRNSALLKASAPRYMTSMPDVDKLARLVLDSLVIAGVIGDDALVAMLRCEKEWHDRSETHLEVWSLQ